MTKVTCEKCGKAFAYEVTGTAYPGAKEKETADCPYCGETAYSEMTSKSIYVYKLNEKGEPVYK